MQTPFFSIITPVYNSIPYLEETIKSVRTQTWTDFEHILIDDGSSDGSVEMIKRYAQEDSRVRLILSDKNGGVSNARNLGLSAAEGKYVCFLDSDDYWESEKLEAQQKQITETSAKFSFMSYNHVSVDGTFLKTVHCPTETNFQSMLRGSVIGCLTVAINRDLLRQKRFKNIFHEDYLFWLEILKDNQLTAHGLDRPLANYRLRPSSRSSDKKSAARAQWNIYRKHLRLPLIYAIPFFANYAVAGIRKHWEK